MILCSYNITGNVSLIQIINDKTGRLFSRMREDDIKLINLNISSSILNIYTEEKQADRLLKILEEENIAWKITEKLCFIKIRFDKPDKILMDIVDTVNILTENKINILELGLTLNRVYLLIHEKDRADFTKLFEEYEYRIK